MSHAAYDDSFYLNRHKNTLHSARTLLDRALGHLPHIRSVMDVGCGVGTWLSCFPDTVARTGIDGPWVPLDYLQIAAKDFYPCHIEQSIADRNSPLWQLPPHDLLISLEVAEHIDARLADDFIAFLTAHCSYVLFSAAIPGQGGLQHVNEQWPSYWAAKFLQHDFLLYDVIRPFIWDDEKIPFWYRQNCFLGAKKGLLEACDAQRVDGKNKDLVHPEQFAIARKRSEPVSLPRRIKRKLLKCSRALLKGGSAL